MRLFKRRARKRYTLFLVSPRMTYRHHATQEDFSRLMGQKRILTPAALPILAALTPDHYDVHLIDEETDPFPRGVRPDIVAISALTTTIDRAYELAKRFRSQGAVTAIGGSYASISPEEVARHADCVFVGEGEETWPRFLADFEAGEIRTTYQAGRIEEFRTSPIPRWDLMDTDNLTSVSIQTSRGCPFNCEFCLVGDLFGRTMRFRDIDDIIREVESSPLKRLFFSDDNFTINPSRTSELMTRLAPLNVSWVCQASIDVADEPELLREMAEAGCMQILIGFESVVQDSLEETRKSHNVVADFSEAVTKIREAGVHVLPSFAIGFDHDKSDIFDRIFDFVQQNNILYPMFSILTAAPGTDLYARMVREGRIEESLDRTWYNGVFPSMHYYNLSMTEMLDGYFDLLERVFDWDAISQRALNAFGTGHFNRGVSQAVPLVDKIRTALLIMRRFAFSLNKVKRKLFMDLFELSNQNKVSMDRVVIFLLTMEGYHDYLKYSRTFLDDIRAEVKRLDRGPWRA